MKLLRFLASISALATLGIFTAQDANAQTNCATLNPGRNSCRIDTADGPRTFVAVVPQNVRPNAVVLADYHGFGGSSQAALGSGLVQLVQRAGFVYVAPDGVGRSHNGLAGCCGQARQMNVDEVAFLKQMFQTVERALNIQPEARFGHGISNGGDAMNRFACQAADFLNAIQPTSFQFSRTGLMNCRPARPVAYQEVHATADNVIPFSGAGPFGRGPADEAARSFAQIQGCNVANATQRRVNSNTTCTAFPGCRSNVAVEMCTVTPGNHSIFPTIGAAGDNVRFVDLSLDFFMRELNRLRQTRQGGGQTAE